MVYKDGIFTTVQYVAINAAMYFHQIMNTLGMMLGVIALDIARYTHQAGMRLLGIITAKQMRNI